MLRKMMEESFASRRGGDHVDLEHDGNLLLKILLRNRPLVAIDEPGGPLDQFTLSVESSKRKSFYNAHFFETENPMVPNLKFSQ